MELKDINSPSLNESSLPPMRCCVNVACKSMTYREDERPGLVHFSDTQPYWCIVTMDPQVPDEGHVKPRLCQPGRLCFQAEE